MDILDDMGASKLSANVFFLKVNYSSILKSSLCRVWRWIASQVLFMSMFRNDSFWWCFQLYCVVVFCGVFVVKLKNLFVYNYWKMALFYNCYWQNIWNCLVYFFD